MQVIDEQLVGGTQGEASASSGAARRDRRAGRRALAIYRHPGDVARLVVGLAVLAGLSVVAAGGVVSRPERNAFRFLNQLPDGLDWPLRVVTQAGWIGAVPLAAAAALVLRRRRLAVDLAVAGGSAWLAAKVVKDLAHRGRPGVLLGDVVLRGVPGAGHGFVSGHAAVAAALATVAAGSVSRRTGRMLWAIVWLVAAARVYSGAHLPLDVVGGAALGWALGGAVRLARGTPGHPPAAAVVAAALARLGLGPYEVRPLRADARGSVPFVADGPAGPLFVKALGRDQRDADLLFRLVRFVAFREVGDEAPLATAKQQLEHEAYLLLLAARAGARVPELVVTADGGDGTWLLAERRIAAVDASAGPVDDAVLDDIWRQVGRLHAAGIAHRDLRLANVLVDGDGRAWLVDFGFAQGGADGQRAGDVAELVASTALVVGAPRAVGVAARVAGVDALRAAAPLMQPLALAAATRRRLAAQPGLLGELRRELAAAGASAPPRPLLRARLRPAMLVAVGAGGYVTHHLLVAAAGGSSVARALGALRWRWVVAAAAAVPLPFLFAALALAAAAGRPLALGRTAAAQLAAALASKGSAPGEGGGPASAAYLCATGIPAEEAAAAVRLTRAAGAVVHAAALAAAGAAAAGAGLRVVDPPKAASVLAAGLALAVAAGVAAWLPPGRRALAGAAAGGLRALRRLAGDRRRTVRLLGAQAALTASLLTVLLASLRAAGADVPVAAAVALYLAVAAVAPAGPLPGGLGIVEPALAGGLMALGAAPAAAVTAVIVFRALTYWLPLAPAAVAYRRLHRQGCW